MSRELRRALIAGLGIVVLATTAAGLAWACTPNAYVGLSPTSGPPGTSVTVNGRGFVPGPVRISWNGSALATATGPDFAVDVTIPAGSSGVGYIAASAQGDDGRAIGQDSRAFRVTTPSAQEGGPKAPAGAAPDRGSPSGSAPASLTISGRERARAGRPERSGATARPTHAAAPRERATAGASTGNPATGAPARAPVTVSAEGRGRGSGSRLAATPSAVTATQDLWSGFRRREGRPALTAGSGPSQTPGSALIGPGLLLGLGLAALAAGLGLGVARRRGSRARSA